MTLKGNRWGIQAWRRRHDAAYGGAGAEWSPADPLPVSGLLPEHWYRSDQGLWQDAGVTPAVLDGDVVGRWEDISANADHVNQANAGNKPTLQSGAADLLGGHPVVRFDGINDYLQGAFTTGGAMAQPNTMFAVAKLDAIAVNDDADHYILMGDDIGNRDALLADNNTAPDTWIIYADTKLVGSASDSNWNIWSALFNGVVSQFWHNGISEAGSGNAGAESIDGLTVGAYFTGAAPWDGDVIEIILYDANLSNADKNTIGNYLATRYALAYTDI